MKNLYPPECPIFEVIRENGWIAVGAIVTGTPYCNDDGLACELSSLTDNVGDGNVDGGSWRGWFLSIRDVRPLTLAARKVLKQVTM